MLLLCSSKVKIIIYMSVGVRLLVKVGRKAQVMSITLLANQHTKKEQKKVSSQRSHIYSHVWSILKYVYACSNMRKKDAKNEIWNEVASKTFCTFMLCVISRQRCRAVPKTQKKGQTTGPIPSLRRYRASLRARLCTTL